MTNTNTLDVSKEKWIPEKIPVCCCGDWRWKETGSMSNIGSFGRYWLFGSSFLELAHFWFIIVNIGSLFPDRPLRWSSSVLESCELSCSSVVYHRSENRFVMSADVSRSYFNLWTLQHRSQDVTWWPFKISKLLIGNTNIRLPRLHLSAQGKHSLNSDWMQYEAPPFWCQL